jgi:hypothetical protein
VERVFADVDADEGDRIPESFCHGVHLVFGAPHKHRLLLGREHGRTIPLTDFASSNLAEANNGDHQLFHGAREFIAG